MMNTITLGITPSPVLTIVIATFNAGVFIKDCLKSITENVLEPYELLIIDGKSKDNTLEIINDFPNITPRIVSEKDKGIYDAMNKGASLATGKWVLFLGADDRILPTFKNIISELHNENTIYYGNCINGENHFNGEFSSYKIAKMNLCHQSIFYPVQVLKKYKYSLKYTVFSDYLLNIQCWGDSNFKKVYKNVNVAYYHMEGFSSITSDPLFKKDKPSLIKKHLGYYIYIRYMFRKFKEGRKRNSKFF